jgi:hypothetical protein
MKISGFPVLLLLFLAAPAFAQDIYVGAPKRPAHKAESATAMAPKPSATDEAVAPSPAIGTPVETAPPTAVGIDGAPGAAAGYPGDDYVPEPAPTPTAITACKPDGYVGRRVLKDGEQKSAEGNEIDPKELAKPFRVIYPDSMVTMDHSEQRLNLTIDRKTRIVMEAHCG